MIVREYRRQLSVLFRLEVPGMAKQGWILRALSTVTSRSLTLTIMRVLRDELVIVLISTLR